MYPSCFLSNFGLFFFNCYILETLCGTVCFLVSFLCCWDKYHDQKQLGEEWVYFILCFQVPIHYWRTSGQQLKQEQQEPWKKTTLWLPFWFMCGSLSYIPQDHLCRNDSAQRGLVHPLSNGNQENAPIVGFCVNYQLLHTAVSLRGVWCTDLWV